MAESKLSPKAVQAEREVRERKRAADPAKGPQWVPPHSPAVRAMRKASGEKEPTRDYVAEARATINAADQNPATVAAVIVAQALDRFGKNLETAAAVANYKRA